MGEPKLIIFDLEGTLIDTVALVVDAFNTAFEESGNTPPAEEAIRSISGLRLDIAVQRLAPYANEELVGSLSESYRQAYLDNALTSQCEPLFPGALAALDKLHERDNSLLAIATGKPLRGTNRILTENSLIGHFTSLQTPDNNPSKPNPDMIYSAMSLVGANKANTIMIGDTNHDIDMAVAAGVKSIAVGWGYHQKSDLLDAGADIFIDEFDMLIETIDELLD